MAPGTTAAVTRTHRAGAATRLTTLGRRRPGRARKSQATVITVMSVALEGSLRTSAGGRVSVSRWSTCELPPRAPSGRRPAAGAEDNLPAQPAEQLVNDQNQAWTNFKLNVTQLCAGGQPRGGRGPAGTGTVTISLPPWPRPVAACGLLNPGRQRASDRGTDSRLTLRLRRRLKSVILNTKLPNTQ